MSKFITYVLLVLFSANVGAWWNIASRLNAIQAETAIHFLDVGQGDAQLIRTNAGNVLIDAGRGSMTALRLLDEILPFTDRAIDIMVLTHPSSDHIGGAKEILNRYDVRLILYTGVRYPLEAYESLMAAARERGIQTLYAIRGKEIIAGDGIFTVLSPEVLLKGVQPREQDVNDTSIVMRFDSGGASAIFTGDISAEKEREIMSAAGDVDVLKVSHHGSRHSSDAEFLRAVRPEIAVISVGRNPYGHPTGAVLERLTAVGARIFRTDQDGTVSVTFKDGKIQVSESR